MTGTCGKELLSNPLCRGEEGLPYPGVSLSLFCPLLNQASVAG